MIETTIIVPAWLAGLIVLATHVPLGRQVLKRGIIFIDLAVAQMAAVGVVVAHLAGWDDSAWMKQVAALTAALAGAALLTWTERRWPQVQEAMIGAIFVLAASLTLLLLARDTHGGEHLQDMLVGQILWVSYGQLLGAAIFSAVVLMLYRFVGLRTGSLGFYAVFACAVTVSVQLVGVYLVFASLIIPALATRQYASMWQIPAASGVGISAYAAGLVLSTLFDLPAGAVIVWALGITGIAFYGGQCYFRRFTSLKQAG
jgi:zinc/manganese transport system permease protein